MNKTAENSITISDLNVVYPGGYHALRDVSLSLPSGRICALVGPNGAGKSTLFKSLMGFVKPQTGIVSIGGLPVRKALKNNAVSYVPQNEDVDWNFPVLAEDVVMMGRYGRMGMLRIPSAKDKQAVDDALERVNMTAFRKHQIGELSGGQKKRVFVARALAQNSDIIFLDEPFTGVDRKTEEALIALLRELADEGHMILVATHNLTSVPQYCDDVALINKTMIAHGAVNDTFTEANMVKAYGSGMLWGGMVAPEAEKKSRKKAGQ